MTWWIWVLVTVWGPTTVLAFSIVVLIVGVLTADRIRAGRLSARRGHSKDE
jgi:hypothetical protein